VREFDHLRDNALVLDVRNARAFHEGHIEGAVHVSHANVSALIDGTARNTPILIYCYHGNASREFGQIFSDFGFSNVCSVDGGYEAWRQQPHAGVGNVAVEPTLRLWLIEQGFSPDDVNAVIANATTPLMRAAHVGSTTVLRMLIAHGATLNARNADGNNALWLACVGRHHGAVDLLIECGIDIDNRNDNGATPLMYAASAGIADVVERLLARGADIAAETLDGFTALDLAGTIECLTLLRRAGRQGS
jgi:thiosulfate/3-mercaptopyruvate sulfurtransferase